MFEDIKKIGVVGAGTMGNGIAHVFSLKGFSVVLIDISDEILRKAIETIKTNMDRQIKKGVITEQDKEKALSLISLSKDYDDLKDADFVVEAIIEDVDAKIEAFRKFDQITPEKTILASNTSSISISLIQGKIKRPDKVIGMHFMNPVPVMQLVEIVRGYLTSDETVDKTYRLAEFLGKTPVVVKDSPGFVANRVLMPMINEAVYLLMEGVATKEGIDTIMKLGANHPMGPLQLADFIGLDVVLAILEILYRETGDPKYRPCPLLRQMVRVGHLGRKSGKGFYDYST